MVKILETRHSQKQYFLVFDGMEIVGKFETEQEAQRFVNELNE
jgi:hypothetical protein